MLESLTIPGVPGGMVRRMDDLPEALPNAIRYSPIGQTDGKTLLLHAEGIGRYRICDGTRIDFTVEGGADPVAVERFLWGNAFVGLIHQRREFPLHGAGVLSADGSRTISLCGASGAGKSTTAAHLLRLGWQSFSDDVTRITVDQNGILAWPGVPTLRLCADACENLGLAKASLVAERDGKRKFILDVPPANAPAPLAAIVILGGPGSQPELEQLRGGVALSALVANVPGRRKLLALGHLREHFLLAQRIVTSCSIFRLHGRATASAQTLSRLISETL